jgi:hypothetical protein
MAGLGMALPYALALAACCSPIHLCALHALVQGLVTASIDLFHPTASLPLLVCDRSAPYLVLAPVHTY